jgi:hypothetical protein
MKNVAGIIITFLLGAMFVSLFHMSMGMDMTGSMSDCPSMAHEEVLCPINLADHIGAWKSAFLAVTPTIVLLLAVTGSLVFIATVAPHLFVPKREPILILSRQLRERTYTFSYRLLQELFSNGVLHPKVF